MKKYTLALTGSDRTREYLVSALEGGFLSHAYIIEGAEGSGRHTLVRRLLMAMACENDRAPCGVCPSCMKIEAGVAVDVRYIRPAEGKTELTVDLIRGIYDTVGMAPSELDFKAYVIESGEKMNANAQNAFLKLFEEPPSNVYFFIITQDASHLLPTIRSRALTLRLDKLDRRQMELVLDGVGIPDDEKRRRAIALADGSAGAAMRIYRDDGDAVRLRSVCDGAVGLLLLPGSDKLGFITYHQKNVKKTDELCLLWSLLQRALRDVMLCRCGSLYSPAYFSDTTEAEKYSENVSDKAVIACQDVISELLALSDTPLNLQLTVTEFASRLWDAHLL